jgi:hypothetical protein
MIEHLLISLAAAIAGITVGGLVGWGLYALARRVGPLPSWFVVFPWRALVVLPPLLTLGSPLITMTTPLQRGRLLGLVLVALLLADLVIPVTIMLLREQRILRPVWQRAIAWGRTFLVVATALMALAALAGGGTPLAQALFLSGNMEAGVTAFRSLFLAGLILDMVAGIVQWLIIRGRPIPSQAQQEGVVPLSA